MIKQDEIERLAEENRRLKAQVVQLESFLASSEHQLGHFRNLIELSDEIGIYRLRTNLEDPTDARLIFVNEAGRRLLGLAPNADYMSWFSRVHPDDREMVVSIQEQALQTGVFKADLRIMVDGGDSWRWVRHHSRAADNAQGKKEYFNGFLWDVTDEVTARREAEEKSRRLRVMSYRLFQQDEHRHRAIAEILHDKIGQELSVARFLLARHAKAPAPPAVIREAIKVLDGVIADTRSLTTEIYPSQLHRLGLIGTLRLLCEQGSGTFGVPIKFHTSTGFIGFDNEVAIFLYRAAFELLINAMKHAGADKVAVSVFEADGAVNLRVADDGRGFDPEAERVGADGGFGLFNIRETLDHLDGRLEVATAPGQGCTVTISIPL